MLLTVLTFWKSIVGGAVVFAVFSPLGNFLHPLYASLGKHLFGDQFFKEVLEKPWRIVAAILILVALGTIGGIAAGLTAWRIGQGPAADPQAKVSETPPPGDSSSKSAPPAQNPGTSRTADVAPGFNPSEANIPVRKAIPVRRPVPGSDFPAAPEPVPTPEPAPTPKPRPAKALAISDGHGGWLSPFKNDFENGHSGRIKHYHPGVLDANTPLEDMNGNAFFLP